MSLSVLICLVYLIGAAYGLAPPPRRRYARQQRLMPRRVTEDPNGANGDSKLLDEDKAAVFPTPISDKAKSLDRCPDFPSFAANGLKSRASRVRLRDEEYLLEKEPPWYSRLTELPMEPGLFLSVADAARRTRLLVDRSYANAETYNAENLNRPPRLTDLDPPSPNKIETFWISIPSRLLSFMVPFLTFPAIMKALTEMMNTSVVDNSQLVQIASDFAPGVAILYGTFLSLTLSVLYNRQQNLQNDIALEASLLMYLTRMVLNLFRSDEAVALQAGQCVADQVRALVKSSRANELILLMYSDPYARLMELVDMREAKLNGDGDRGQISNCRDTLREIVKVRSQRLSDEALFLPPTHFFVLTTLTMLILLGYCVTVLPSVADGSSPSLESSLLFGILCAVYIFFYNFANDLNNPFEGVYQIRRSSCASQLLAIKFLLVNNPLTKECEFEELQEQAEEGSVRIRSPGIGDMWFDKDDIYPRPS